MNDQKLLYELHAIQRDLIGDPTLTTHARLNLALKNLDELIEKILVGNQAKIA